MDCKTGEVQSCISVYKEELSVCLCESLHTWPHDLRRPSSDLRQIWPAHAETKKVEIEAVVVYRTSSAMTRFLADRTCLRHAKISGGTARQISTEFKLPVTDVGLNARSVSIIAGNVERDKIFSVSRS